jgi:tetraacyldisaccharide 4'-kinase
MVSEAPPFWWQPHGIQSALLSPFGWVYGRVARRILDRRVRKAVDAPVICVGNFTVGGSGKTPTALALAEAALARGLKPGFLSPGIWRQCPPCGAGGSCPGHRPARG